MRQSDKYINIIIDKYYGEDAEQSNEHDLANEDTIQEFNDKFHISLNKMDLIKDLDFELNINIMDIIERAEETKSQNKFRYELLGFIAACTLILTFLIIFIFSINLKILIYSELILSLLLPLSVIPFSRNAKVKGEV